MIGTSSTEVETWVRIVAVLGGGGGALWITIRLLWRLQSVIEARFESTLDRARADCTRLEIELIAERVSCRHQLDELGLRISAQDARITALIRAAGGQL